MDKMTKVRIEIIENTIDEILLILKSQSPACSVAYSVIQERFKERIEKNSPISFTVHQIKAFVEYSGLSMAESQRILQSPNHYLKNPERQLKENFFLQYDENKNE